MPSNKVHSKKTSVRRSDRRKRKAVQYTLEEEEEDNIEGNTNTNLEEEDKLLQKDKEEQASKNRKSSSKKKANPNSTPKSNVSGAQKRKKKKVKRRDHHDSDYDSDDDSEFKIDEDEDHGDDDSEYNNHIDENDGDLNQDNNDATTSTQQQNKKNGIEVEKADAKGAAEREEREEIFVTPKQKGTKRKSTSTAKSASTSTEKSTGRRSRAKTSSNTKKGIHDPGSVEDRTCPYCNKVFTIANGLAYHIEHKVCLREPTMINASRKRLTPGTYPFPKLEPNSKFLTPYGVVKVISDSRMPEDHNKTCLPKDVGRKHRVYARKDERIQTRKMNFMLFHAKKQRRRRIELMNIQQKEIDEKRDHPLEYKQNQNEREVEKSKEIWRLYSTLIEKPSLILTGKYSQNLDPKMHDQVQNVEKHPWNYLGQDPVEPIDSYPDRIVECVLIEDERMKINDLNIGTDPAKGQLLHMNIVKKSVEKAREEILNMKKNGTSTRIENAHPSGLRLFLRRRLLVNSYDSEIPIYQCSKTGKVFQTIMGLTEYLKNKESPTEITRKNIERRDKRLQEIEKAAISKEKIKGPQPLSVKKETVASGSGSKTKRKKHKKWPAWLEFYPDLSVIYPEVFDVLKYRRGSNNSTYLKKKFHVIGPGRKKVRRSRASINWHAHDWIKNKSFKPVYPEVMMYFFSEYQAEPKPKSPVAKNVKVLKNNSNVKVALSAPNGKKSKYKNENGINSETFRSMPPLPPALGREFEYSDALSPPIPDLGLKLVPLGAQSPTCFVTPTRLPKPTTESSKRNNVDIILNKSQKDKTTQQKMSNHKILDPIDKKDANGPTSPPKDVQNDREKNGDTQQKKTKRKRRPPASTAKKDTYPIIVDIKPLVEEIRAGRFPSMKEYTGDRADICFVCKNRGGDDLFFCEFCENSEHLSCVQTKVAIRDPETDDGFMCHKCIQTVVTRRGRAERRRQQKLEEAIAKSPAGGNINNTISSTSLLEEARAATALKSDIVWNQTEFDSHKATFTKCPSGGPGGLICCSFCTSAYSRLLSETSKEMDTQTVSSVGREVSELVQLLHDAKTRLQQALDVSNGNDVRMSLLNKEQVSFADSHSDIAAGTAINDMNATGFLGIFEGN